MSCMGDMRKGSRSYTRFKDKKEAAEPEADPERDQRTVFAYQMPLKATERDVFEFFSRAGKVRNVKLIMDRNSRRSKGAGYIEFYDAISVPIAIALSGHLFLGQPLTVKPSEAEPPHGVTDRKLYVGNLNFNMTEFQLRQILKRYGPLSLCNFLPSQRLLQRFWVCSVCATGTCKGGTEFEWETGDCWSDH